MRSSHAPHRSPPWRRTARSLLERALAPVDVGALVAFRVGLGLLVAIGSLRFILNGWIERFFVEPAFAFKYWGFSWVQAWPAWGMYLHFGVLTVLGLCVAAGLFYRVTIVLTFVGFTYLELIDVTYYLNHYYLLSLLLLLAAFMPLGRAGSIDAWRQPERATSHFPRWCQDVLRFQVAVVYFYAGVAKLGEDWLLHAQPLNIWLSSSTDLPLVGPYLGVWWVALLMSWAGFFYDTTIWIWLSWRKTRPFAFAVVVVFHTAVGILFNIGMFPFIMVVAATVFFEPDWVRRWLPRRDAGPSSGRVTATWTTKRKLAAGALGLFAVVQLLAPLRHLAYPGSVIWNEQGMRWAWKVLVREKNGAVTYYVTLPPDEAGHRRVHVVSPHKYLTDIQEREMSGQPDLILQLAHHIADDYQRRGLGPVQVRVEARVSLNGRRSRLLIDPDVDLTEVSDGLAIASWILPEPTEPPARLRAIAER